MDAYVIENNNQGIDGDITPESSSLRKARENLGEVVRYFSRATTQRLGITWEPAHDAPSTYGDLLSAFNSALHNKTPLPVSSLHCDESIYLDPQENMMFRFWHDCEHVTKKSTFALGDEFILAWDHMRDIESLGYDSTTLEWKLFHSDTVGQVMACGVMGRFPNRKLDFALNSVNYGVDEAIRQDLTNIIVLPDSQESLWTP